MKHGKQSVFRDERKKWEPINKQAAGVFRKATWDQAPAAQPKFLPSPKEQAEAIRLAAEARYNMLKAESDQIEASRAQQPPPPPTPKFAKCFKHAKATLRAIHKRNGLPTPTCKQVHAFAKTLPMYGQKLHA